MPANPSSTTATATSKAVTDPKTGQSYAAPSYSAFSLKGLTSTDPANVARNREAAAMYASKASSSSSSGGGGGILSLRSSGRSSDRNSSKPTTTPADLASIGAPNRPTGPVEVPTPDYGLASLVPRGDGAPSASYGQAFTNAMSAPAQNPYQNVSLMDIFGMFPDFANYQNYPAFQNYAGYPGYGYRV